MLIEVDSNIFCQSPFLFLFPVKERIEAARWTRGASQTCSSLYSFAVFWQMLLFRAVIGRFWSISALHDIRTFCEKWFAFSGLNLRVHPGCVFLLRRFMVAPWQRKVATCFFFRVFFLFLALNSIREIFFNGYHNRFFAFACTRRYSIRKRLENILQPNRTRLQSDSCSVRVIGLFHVLSVAISRGRPQQRMLRVKNGFCSTIPLDFS